MTEAALLRQLLVHGSTLGCRLFRNNVGRAQLTDGRWLVYGLCVGSSDVIGWTPYVVRHSDVGRTLAVFTALETKVGRNTTTVEQGAFLATVKAAGGLAAVVRRLADADAAVRSFQ